MTTPGHVWVPVIDAFLIGIIIASIFGNLLVCSAIAIDHKLRKPGNVFIASLAVADLLVAVIVMPFSLSTDIIDADVFGPVFCKVWICADVVFSSSSLVHLCVISIDRYVHLKKPFLYKRRMTMKVAMAVMSIVWVVTVVKPVIPIWLGWVEYEVPVDQETNLNATVIESSEGPSMLGWSMAGYVYCDHAFSSTFIIVSCLVHFYIPATIMILMYARIFLLVRKRTKSLRAGQISGYTVGGADSHSKADGMRVSCQHTSDVKAVITLGTIMGLFLTCWSPLFIYLLNCAVRHCYSFHSKKDEVLNWLGYFNSCLNPCVYAIGNPQFRRAFKAILYDRPKACVSCSSPRQDCTFTAISPINN